MSEKADGNILSAARTFVDPSTGVSGASNIWAPKWFTPLADPDQNRLLFKTLALSATYGTTAFLVKALANKHEEARRKAKGQLVPAAIQASNPIISPDANLGDLAAEQKKLNVGIAKESQDTLTGYVGPAVEKGLGGVATWARDLVAPNSKADTMTIAVPLVAAIMAAGTGIYAADKLNIGRRKEDSKTRLDTAMNEMDALNNAKLMLARGSRPPGLKKLLARSSIKKEAWGITETKNMIYAALALTAVASGTLGYMATKEFMDARDPRRIKQKMLDDELQQAELKQGLGTPQVSLNLDPATARELDKHIEGPRTRRTITRPTTAAVNIEPASARPPMQRDLLTL